MQLEERSSPSIEEILAGDCLCPFCGTPTSARDLAEASWLPPAAVAMLEERYPRWELAHGACPACVQRIMREVLLAKGEQKVGEAFASEFSVTPELAFGVLPTHMRLHVDERYQGRGVTLALVDSGFYPHPDLTTPRNRIRAWVNATTDPVSALYFDADDQPEWPGWNSASDWQWHGTMTTGVAAGNGHLSHGLYRGLAPEAEVVLVQARGKDGSISNETITRALRWLEEHGPELGVRIVSLSVAGEPVRWLAGNPVDEAVAALVKQGVTVVTAAGNAGTRDLVPPATAPDALTIGGLDDHNNFDHEDIDVWHSNYGETVTGRMKPELVAPSIWVAAPVLPGSTVAKEAEVLFSRRHLREPGTEARLVQQKLLTPHYQHVDGTSFAAPIVASVVACLLEANPNLTPGQVRQILTSTAQPIAGVALERQGAGALNSTLALAAAERVEGAPLSGYAMSPNVTPYGVTFYLYDRHTHSVHVQGSWDDWASPGVEAEQILPNIWRAHIGNLRPGRYTYRFLLGGVYWLADPDNPVRTPNEYAGFDSVLEIPEQPPSPNPVVATVPISRTRGRKGRTKKATV